MTRPRTVATPTPPPGGVALCAAALAALLGACAPTPAPAPASDPASPAAGFACGADATPIARVQGAGPVSPLAGTTVDVEGVVSAVLKDGLGVIVLESPAAARDADPATSEALFVALAGARRSVDRMPSRIRPGVRMRVRGTVGEIGDRHGATALVAVEDYATCAKDVEPLPETVLAAAPASWETLEGMRVRIPDGLTITGNGAVRWTGVIAASFAGRLYEPTEVAAPGDAAKARRRANAEALVLLDDGFRDEPVGQPWYLGRIDAEHAWRVGTTLADVVGIASPRDGAWRLELLEPLKAREFAPRPAAPPDVGGDVRVAAFNVLNLFNGDGKGGGFPTPRGATSATELEAQLAKIVAAIGTMSPDVAALMEIENDGTGPDSAQTLLVDALNRAPHGGDWRMVGPKLRRLGPDEIRVALIYRSSRVRTVGAPAQLDAAPFRDLSRVPLAQTFVAGDGVPFTVVAVHLKSKGSCPTGAAPGADVRDGQGCWNDARRDAARALGPWALSDPTGTGVRDVVLIGDFNAHTQEDPLRELRDAGWVDVVAKSAPAGAPHPYSYVFMGRSGHLDHALATASFAARVTGAAQWHINADELEAFDFETEGKSARQRAQWYRPDPFRASDHDPLVVGLRAR